jgi:hypothetical protein
MSELRSSDYMILARACLHAAIRNEIDLLELLPTPTRSPVKPAPELLAQFPL